MNSTNRGAVYGMLLGDGSVHKIKNGNCVLQITHQEKQKEYLDFKSKRIKSIFGGKLNAPRMYESETKYGKVKYYKTSKSHKYLNQVRRVCYPFGRKTITRQWLDYVNPEGLAYWYLDDGSLNKVWSKDKSYVSSFEMRIYTYCDEDTVDLIIKYFEEVWRIKAKKRFAKREKKYNVVFNTTEGRKFELLIKDYVIPSMRYKLPSKWVTRAQSIS